MYRWRNARLALATILCVALLPACYDWHVPEIGPSEYITDQEPAIVRLTLVDGSSTDIVDPAIVDGAIVGILGPSGRGRQMVDSTVSVPLDTVTRVEVRRLSQMRTGVVATLSVAALLLTVGGVFSNWVHR